MPIESLEDYLKHGEALVDPRGLPATESPISMNDFNQLVQKFVDVLESRGMRITPNAVRRFALYSWAQYDSGTVINDDTLRVLFERCLALNIFKGEITGYAEMVAAQEARKPKPAKTEPTFDDLASKLSTQSDAGNRALKIAAVDGALTGEIREMWAAFEASLYRNLNGFVLTRKQGELILKVMQERSLNLLRPADYDQVRVSLARTGELPSNLIYPSEQIQIDLETADLSKPEVRREFNRRERQLQERR